MNGKAVREHLARICSALDEGVPLDRLRRALVPAIGGAVLGGALLLGGCEPARTDGPAQPAAQEVCGDGWDNDGDGQTDCLDIDCESAPPCAAVTMYGAPPVPAEVCGDGVDNDRDGLADCRDPDCAGDRACSAVIMYGAPPAAAEVCGDGVDNDGDGQVDCSDGDCSGAPACAVERYGAPFRR